MTGIEILTSAEVVSETTCNGDLACIIGASIIVFCTIIGVILDIKSGEMECSILGFMLGLLAGFIGFCVTMGITEKPTAYETQYKVTISDEVTVSDFYEHYEVIEQDGKIFTVKEKTNET